LGALNLIPEEAQASSSGRKEERPNPSDESMTTGDPVIDTPAKVPFSESGALKPIPEEAHPSSTGREEERSRPDGGKLAVV